MKVSPLAVLLGLALGACSTLAGVYLLAGLAIALIVGGAVLSVACLLVDS